MILKVNYLILKNIVLELTEEINRLTREVRVFHSKNLEKTKLNSS